MSEFRDLQAKLQRIEEGYFNDLDIDLQELRRANKRLSPVELVSLARQRFGQDAATHLSNELEREGDAADYLDEDELESDNYYAADCETCQGDGTDGFTGDCKACGGTGYNMTKNPEGDDDFWDWTSKYPGLDEDDNIKGVNDKYDDDTLECKHCGDYFCTSKFGGECPEIQRDLFDEEFIEEEESFADRVKRYKGETDDIISANDRRRQGRKYAMTGPSRGRRSYGRGTGSALGTLGMTEDLHSEDPISVQIKSLLAMGKEVRSQIVGAIGKVTKTDGRFIYIQPPGRRPEGVTSFDSGPKVKIVGNVDHYDIVKDYSDDEGILGQALGGDLDEAKWDYPKVMKGKGAQQHEFGPNTGADNRADRKAFRKAEKAKAHQARMRGEVDEDSTRPNLGTWQDYDPDEEVNPNEWEWETDSNILAYDKENRELRTNRGRDEEFELDEARGRVVEVPPELRGTDAGNAAGATSRDAERFLADLGPDDDVSHDVVDPETGELLDWPTGGLSREETEDAAPWRSSGGTKRERGKAKFKAGRTRDFDAVPILHLSSEGGDFGEGQDQAGQFLSELRDSDFYNVVWRDIADDVEDPEMMRDNDYDIDVEIPVLLKRKDGKKLTDDDHDNIKEIMKAVKLASTLGNIGIGYAGTTDNGTTARFHSMFH